MPVTASDLIYYGSANMPEDDVSTVGGAIDLTRKPIFTDISPAGLVEMVSDNAGDTTQTITLTGLNSVNSEITEVKTLNGTTPVDFTTTWKVIWKAVKSATTVGTITVRKDGDAGDLMVFDKTPNEIDEVRRIFYKTDSEVGAEDNYAKVFVKNTHATDSLSTAQVKQQADPTGLVTFDLEDAKNDTNSAANRTTVPSGMLGSFDDTDKSVPTGNLDAGDAMGIWLKLGMGAGQGATISSFTVRTEGNSA